MMHLLIVLCISSHLVKALYGLSHSVLIASNYRTLTSAFFLNESNSLMRGLVAASLVSPPYA